MFVIWLTKCPEETNFILLEVWYHFFNFFYTFGKIMHIELYWIILRVFFYLKRLFWFTCTYMLEENMWFTDRHQYHIFWKKMGERIFFYYLMSYNYMLIMKDLFIIKTKKFNNGFNSVWQCPVNNKYTCIEWSY